MAVFKVARERQDFGEVCKYKDKIGGLDVYN